MVEKVEGRDEGKRDEAEPEKAESWRAKGENSQVREGREDVSKVQEEDQHAQVIFSQVHNGQAAHGQTIKPKRNGEESRLVKAHPLLEIAEKVRAWVSGWLVLLLIYLNVGG